MKPPGVLSQPYESGSGPRGSSQTRSGRHLAAKFQTYAGPGYGESDAGRHGENGEAIARGCLLTLPSPKDTGVGNEFTDPSPPVPLRRLR